MKRNIKIGIVLSGELQNIQIDYNGNQNIIASFEPSDIFGESLVMAEVKNAPINIVAVKLSEVLFLDYGKILSVCSNACTFHMALLKNMLKLAAKKNIMLNRKLQHLTKRSTKDKIMSYLNEQSKLTQNSRFVIPFDRQELADYLSVDRSALSAELSKLQRDGYIAYKKNEFELK